MKKLLALILSAALLCPMWAGAQTTTTPSIQGPLHYVGSLTVYAAKAAQLNPAYFAGTCTVLTDLRLNIQSANNVSPIKDVSGYYNCSGGSWSTFAGALVAMNSSGLPNTSNEATTGYLGTFTLGSMQMNCSFPADLSTVFCQLFASDGTFVGQGPFKYTSVP
jgi:hypothetical protein